MRNKGILFHTIHLMSYTRVVYVLLLLLSAVFLNALSYLKGKERITFLA